MLPRDDDGVGNPPHTHTHTKGSYMPNVGSPATIKRLMPYDASVDDQGLPSLQHLVNNPIGNPKNRSIGGSGSAKPSGVVLPKNFWLQHASLPVVHTRLPSSRQTRHQVTDWPPFRSSSGHRASNAHPRPTPTRYPWPRRPIIDHLIYMA